jgi:hypothetical protein
MKYFLPMYALVWLMALYASSALGTEYGPDLRGGMLSDGRVGANLVAGASYAALGVKPGTPVDAPALERLSLPERERFTDALYGTPIAVPFLIDGKTAWVTAPATVQMRPKRPWWQNAMELAGITFALVLAGYLGFRRPGLMMTAFITFLGGGALSWPAFTVFFSAGPLWLYSALVLVMASLCNWFPVLVLASFAVRLPGNDDAQTPAAAVRVVDAIVLFGFIVGLFQDLNDWLIGGVRFYEIATALSAAVVIASCAIALRYAPADRGRVGIVFAAVMAGGVGYAANMIWVQHGENFLVFVSYATWSVVIVAVALAYTILRHRIFDVAFVLNRTIVYALTSALVLVAFAAMEFAVERYVNALTQVESIALEFLIAIVVIVSVRLVHARVDRFVDSVLFRARHEQESALRRFATTLQFYTADAALVRDAVDALVRYGRVQGGALYLTAGADLECAGSTFSSAASRIDENDPALVELRAHHEKLQLQGMPTAFLGERLYPMVLAGRLVGVLATGARESGEHMPPDIDEAISGIASAVAISLAAIETDRIRQENAMLQMRLAGQRS